MKGSDGQPIAYSNRGLRATRRAVVGNPLRTMTGTGSKWMRNADVVPGRCAVDHVGDPRRVRATEKKYYDDDTWEKLDPEGMKQRESAEVERFRNMGVYEYTGRAAARHDEEGGGEACANQQESS